MLETRETPETPVKQFNPRRVWLEELLSRPDLWRGNVDALRVLAVELGVDVGFFRRDLNDWAAGWQLVERTGGNHETVANGDDRRGGDRAGGGAGMGDGQDPGGELSDDHTG